MNKCLLKIIYPVAIIGLIAGSLFANINADVSGQGDFNLLFMEKLENMYVSFDILFKYILMERGKTWIIVGLLLFSGFHATVFLAYIMYTFFMIGCSCSMFVMVYGAKGILVFSCINFLSQMIFLLSVFLLYASKNAKKNKILIIFFACIFLLLSVIIESYFCANITKII